MEFRKASSPDEGIALLAERIIESLSTGKKALWLVPGGSNIPFAAHAMEIVRRTMPAKFLGNLILSLTDERYGPPGHKDSNWQGLIDNRFDFTGIRTMPILMGASLEDTVSAYGRNMEEAMREAETVIGQFGIGADGHIAGVLPHTLGADSKAMTVGYVAEPFTRVSLSLEALKSIDVAFAFALGDSKKKAIADLREKDLPLSEEPAQILKELPEAYLWYT